MGRKKSEGRKSQAYWEAYAAEVAGDREAVGADADAAKSPGQGAPEPMKTSDLYMTVDEYIDILVDSVKKTYSMGGARRYHPEDIAINFEVANEILSRSMGRLIRSRLGRAS